MALNGKRNDCIAKNITHTAKEKIRVLVFNKFNVDPFFMLSTNFTDTNYRYDCYITHKTDYQSIGIQNYVEGIIDTINSY
jgi:hypothetical protein